MIVVDLFGHVLEVRGKRRLVDEQAHRLQLGLIFRVLRDVGKVLLIWQAYGAFGAMRDADRPVERREVLHRAAASYAVQLPLLDGKWPVRPRLLRRAQPTSAYLYSWADTGLS